MGQGQLLELERDATLHALRPEIPPALAHLDVLVAKDLRDSLRRRLARHGIEGLSSTCEAPDEAVREVLAALPT